MPISPDALTKLRDLLARIADGTVDPRASAKAALKIVDQLIAAADKNDRSVPAVEYIVEDSANGPVLTERRQTGRAYPFRCPKAVYDATAAVLAKADRALPLDEIMSGVAEVLGDQAPDYQVRVPLRLWLHVDPPLIARMRARYRAASNANLLDGAATLWTRLQRE